VLQAKVGEYVEQDQPLLTIHANDARRLEDARQLVQAGIELSTSPVARPRLILERVPAAG
jgi:thymidine phosphorylase